MSLRKSWLENEIGFERDNNREGARGFKPLNKETDRIILWNYI